MSDILIIGIGNEFRSDDAVGILIARKIKSLNLPQIEVIEANGEGSELIELWKDKKSVIICDAVSSGSEPGKIHQIDASKNKVSTNFFNYSSHAFGLAEAIEISRKLNQLPDKLLIYGIEGKNFNFGKNISEEMIKASDQVIKLIVDMVETHPAMAGKHAVSLP